MKIAISTLALTLALSGCDHVVNKITPGDHKLVEAEADEGVNRGMMVGWLACSGKVEVTQTANGYAVNFTDRQWNDAKTVYVDVDTYLQTKRVTVRPMNAEEISICNTGHGGSVSQTQLPQANGTPPAAGDDDCYDSNGNLMPDQFSAFSEPLVSCGPGSNTQTKVLNGRTTVAWRVWVAVGGGDKAVTDSKYLQQRRPTTHASNSRCKSPQDSDEG